MRTILIAASYIIGGACTISAVVCGAAGNWSACLLNAAGAGALLFTADQLR